MSSNVAIRREPTTVKRRSLCGSSHDRCRCAESPDWKRMKQKTTSSTPLADVGRSVGDDLHGLLAGEPQHHRHVVRAEAPERVLVRAELAEVQPVAVDVVDPVAELARVGQLLQLLRRRGGTRAGAPPSACARTPPRRAPPARRRRPTARAASRRSSACRPRARGWPVPRGWARAWPARPRRAWGRRAAPPGRR